MSNDSNDLPGSQDRSNPGRVQGADSSPHIIPPELPPELLLPEGADEILVRLEAIWLQATPDTIGEDLELARRVAGAVRGEDAEVAQRSVTALIRLEHCLRDR